MHTLLMTRLVAFGAGELRARPYTIHQSGWSVSPVRVLTASSGQDNDRTSGSGVLCDRSTVRFSVRCSWSTVCSMTRSCGLPLAGGFNARLMAMKVSGRRAILRPYPQPRARARAHRLQLCAQSFRGLLRPFCPPEESVAFGTDATRETIPHFVGVRRLQLDLGHCAHWFWTIVPTQAGGNFLHLPLDEILTGQFITATVAPSWRRFDSK
jgi:hypothetical protein